MQLETVINKTLRFLDSRIESLSLSVTSGGVDNMEKYKYMLGQAHAYVNILQEISNLLNPKKEDKNEQRVDRFALEEQVDSIVISVDQKTRTLNLSIKEIEINDEKEALSKYGSSDSGASLGDILGSILKKKE